MRDQPRLERCASVDSGRLRVLLRPFGSRDVSRYVTLTEKQVDLLNEMLEAATTGAIKYGWTEEQYLNMRQALYWQFYSVGRESNDA